MALHHTATADQTQRSRRIRALWQLMRADKPVGVWLLWLPCCWATALAGSLSWPEHLRLLLLFLLGAFAMRSAGCIVNDLTDRTIDQQVARTRSRPLASGALTQYDALCLLTFLLSVALLVVVQMQAQLLWWAAGSLVLVIAYPWMKRITYWPQAFLGITFSIGALFGWIAATGAVALPAFFLYAASICWTIAYDTLYAHQDIEDDMRIGVKSTAIRFGAHNQLIISIFYVIAGALLAVAITTKSAGPAHAVTMLPAMMLAVGGVALAFFTDYHTPSSCLRRFKQNVWLGILIAIGLLITG